MLALVRGRRGEQDERKTTRTDSVGLLDVGGGGFEFRVAEPNRLETFVLEPE